MNADTLRALQAPLKEEYRETPEAALITLRAHGRIGDGITCKVETGRVVAEAGLHPATGGDGLALCSGVGAGQLSLQRLQGGCQPDDQGVSG